MDPISQAALGAVVGQLAGHRRLGRRAALAGAFAGALPDIDVLFSVNGDYFDQLRLHRGITHSLLFSPVAGPILGWALWQWDKRVRGSPGPLRVWMLVTSLALLSHPLLDLLTPYGTQLLLPFSDARFAVSAMPIIDPVYTTLLLVGLLAARRWAPSATRIAALTLITSGSYLGYGWVLNERAVAEAESQLARSGVSGAQVAAFPTVFQLHYRRVVARTDTEDRVGFISMWAPCPIDWGVAPRTASERVAVFLDTREGRIFDWFTMGWAHYADTIVDGVRTIRATDLRYGATNDPTTSIFMASMNYDGNTPARVQAGRTLPDGGRLALARLAADTYAPMCRLSAAQ